MKIEHLIVQHLYLTKSVTLQGIGTITLNPSVILPGDNDKDKSFVFPPDAFQFTYNLKAGEDEALVKHIVQHSRKIYPLASADLESYVILAKQFLNIGKPLIIEGVGSIIKNQVGEYAFTQGAYVTPRIEEAAKPLKENLINNDAYTDEDITTGRSSGKGNSRALLAVFVLLLIAGAAYGVYYYVTNRQSSLDNATVDSVQQVEPAPVATSNTTIDTITKAATDTQITATTVQPVVAKDSSAFKVVIKDYHSQEMVNAAYGRLTKYGYKLVIEHPDSSKYQLAMPFKAGFTDTLKAKDSVRILFACRPYIIR